MSKHLATKTQEPVRRPTEPMTRPAPKRVPRALCNGRCACKGASSKPSMTQTLGDLAWMTVAIVICGLTIGLLARHVFNVVCG